MAGGCEVAGIVAPVSWRGLFGLLDLGACLKVWSAAIDSFPEASILRTYRRAAFCSAIRQSFEQYSFGGDFPKFCTTGRLQPKQDVGGGGSFCPQ